MGQKRKTAFPNYKGEKRYTVKHPDHGETTVTAPNEDAAIVAAARYWNTQWTKYQFYSFCQVSRADEPSHPMF